MSAIETFLTTLQQSGIAELKEHPIKGVPRLLGKNAAHTLAFEWLGPVNQPARITLSGLMLPSMLGEAGKAGTLMFHLLAALFPTWQERGEWLVLSMRRLAVAAENSKQITQIDQTLGPVRMLLRYQPKIRMLTLVIDLRGASYAALTA